MNITEKEKMFLDYMYEQAQNAMDFVEKNGIELDGSYGYFINDDYIHASMGQDYKSGNTRRIISKTLCNGKTGYYESLYEDEK